MINANPEPQRSDARALDGVTFNTSIDYFKTYTGTNPEGQMVSGGLPSEFSTPQILRLTQPARIPAQFRSDLSSVWYPRILTDHVFRNGFAKDALSHATRHFKLAQERDQGSTNLIQEPQESWRVVDLSNLDAKMLTQCSLKNIIKQKVCQDFACVHRSERAIVAVVADGISIPGESHFAARLLGQGLAHIGHNILSKHNTGLIVPSSLAALLHFRMVHHYCRIAYELKVKPEDLGWRIGGVSLVGVAITPQQTTVFALGDGFLKLGSRYFEINELRKRPALRYKGVDNLSLDPAPAIGSLFGKVPFTIDLDTNPYASEPTGDPLLDFLKDEATTFHILACFPTEKLLQDGIVISTDGERMGKLGAATLFERTAQKGSVDLLKLLELRQQAALLYGNHGFENIKSLLYGNRDFSGQQFKEELLRLALLGAFSVPVIELAKKYQLSADSGNRSEQLDMFIKEVDALTDEYPILEDESIPFALDDMGEILITGGIN